MSNMTPEGKEKLREATRQRWAKARAAGRNTLAIPKGTKRAGFSNSRSRRRTISPETRKRMSLAQRARFARYRNEKHSIPNVQSENRQLREENQRLKEKLIALLLEE